MGNRLLTLGIPGRRGLGRYVAGASLSSATFSRASVATYTDNTTNTLFDFDAGDSLASATFSRASTANFTATNE